MAQVAVTMTSEEAGLWQGFQKIVGKQVEMERGFGKVGRAARGAGRQSKQAFGGPGIKMLKTFVGGLIGGMGVSAAISKVNEGWQVWLRNMREISAETRKASQEVVAFAALQAGGTKAERVMEASALAARYGIADRGMAFNAVQALQSAHDDFKKGMRAAETVFAAGQVGIPIEKGLELEVLGAAQQQKPGQALRRAYVAGQLSARDPAVLAGGAAGLAFWDDKDLANAAAAVIAGSIPADRLGTYLKQAGRALSKTGPLQPAFEEMGVGDASRLQRLKELHRRGIDTAEELEQIGSTEIRQTQALTALVPNVQTVARIAGEIRKQAQPGIFPTHRRAIEAEMPWMKTAREIEMLESRFKQDTAFGRRAAGIEAPSALQIERQQRIRGLAMRGLGMEQGAWFDLIDEEGRATRWAEWRAKLHQIFIYPHGREGIGGPPHPYERLAPEMRAIEEWLEKNNLNAEQQVEELKRLNRNMEGKNGNATLAHPDDDPGARKRE